MNTDAIETFVPQNADELRDNWLRDIRLEALARGIEDPPVQPGTDLWIRATAHANADLIQYSNIAIADQASDVLTATGDALDDKRRAFGLPEVEPSPSTGNLTVGVLGGGFVTLTTSLQFVLPNGKRGKVASNTIVSDGDPVPVVTIDTGADTNLDAGRKVRWVAGPLNLETDATVASGGLTGGVDEESDDRKRERILNELGHLRAGGNWSQKIEVALEALANLQYAVDYPALGGPGSEKLVLFRELDPDNNDWSREVSAPDVAIVQAAMEENFALPFEMVVQSVEDQPFDVALVLALPEFASNGWVNSPVWPQLESGDTHVEVSLYGGLLSVVVNAATATSPVANVTQIAWWSPFDQTFYVKTVTSVAGGSGLWILGIDSELIDSLGNVALPGHYISPAAVNMDAYGDSWRVIMGGLGPGENTSNAAILSNGRGKRRPTTSEKFPSNLTVRQIETLIEAHAEIEDADYSYPAPGSRGPNVPSNLADAPLVLTPHNFGIYQAV
jgi:hypothetical protein